MRKITFISLFIALFASVSMQAQENAYNMVIEMNNGTKITIGPNDVKNITFNDGELVVTGPSLQEWMQSVELAIEQRAMRVELDDVIYDVKNALQANMQGLRDEFLARLANLENEYYSFLSPLANYVGGSYWDPERVANNLNATLEDLKQRIEALESRGVNKPAAQAGQSPE